MAVSRPARRASAFSECPCGTRVREWTERSQPENMSFTFLLHRQRTKHGLSLAEVAERLGAKSLNTYARYEQGKSVPTVEKFNQLLSAVSPEMDFVLVESQDQRLIQGTH